MATLNQEQIWNKIAGDWSKYRPNAIFEVKEFLKDKKGKMLDLGCGSGRNMVLQEGLEYYGCDFSAKMIEFAKQKAEKIGVKAHLRKMNADKLQYYDEFFDVAIFFSTLHCIENETLRKKSLQELFRILKTGGEAMISVWDKNKDENFKKIEVNAGFVDWKKDGVVYKRYYYAYDEDELVYLLKEVGFEILRIGEYGDGKHEKKNLVIYVRKN